VTSSGSKAAKASSAKARNAATFGDRLVTESTGKIQSEQLVAEVVSYESVFVPAGSFLAHRVVITVGGQGFCEVWYAPETKTVVRGITPDAQGREVISELVDYQKGSATGYVDR
jgi:hypothetical protein